MPHLKVWPTGALVDRWTRTETAVGRTFRSGAIQSWRSAIIGSTRPARRAGTSAAASALATSTTGATANDGASNGTTPYNRLARYLAPHAALNNPAATPP